ncbi:hypothetical protein EVAR_88085_1 [Eumeta japonica]|uniref:Uncharacterized protein n=1 Tax=Eumeta variegata TaxID=151549 RepID=A0A4C1WIS8_EUMVA|nr:hypothetical protein EVAR_88085_1 [Eumeta japonica]
MEVKIHQVGTQRTKRSVETVHVLLRRPSDRDWSWFLVKTRSIHGTVGDEPPVEGSVENCFSVDFVGRVASRSSA